MLVQGGWGAAHASITTVGGGGGRERQAGWRHSHDGRAMGVQQTRPRLSKPMGGGGFWCGWNTVTSTVNGACRNQTVVRVEGALGWWVC